MPRIVRDIQLLVNDNDDHLYGYRLSDGTEVRIGTSRPDNAAAVVGGGCSPAARAQPDRCFGVRLGLRRLAIDQRIDRDRVRIRA